MHTDWLILPKPDELPEVCITDHRKPLISVITPSFNQAGFIRETIESVLSQDYPNIEHWVIDGGSTDSTVDVLKEFEQDPRFNWISERDRGQADAVNKGFLRCRGSLIGWLNSDDVFLPNALAVMEREFVCAEIGAVFGDALRVTANGSPIEIMKGRDIETSSLLRQNYINQPASLIRREILEDIGPLRVELRYALDYEMFLRIASRFRIRYVPQLLATYRMHDSSKSTVGGPTFVREMIDVIQPYLNNTQLDDGRGELRRLAAHECKRLLADRKLELCIEHIKLGQWRDAKAAIREAIGYSAIRPRMFFVVLNLIERTTNFGVARLALSILQRIRRIGLSS